MSMKAPPSPPPGRRDNKATATQNKDKNTDKEEEQSSNPLSPVMTFFKAIVTPSPSKTTKASDVETEKKCDKMPKQKIKRKTKKSSEVVAVKSPDGKAMIQTTLSKTTEGIEVISSPEQKQKSKAKIGRKSRKSIESEKKNKTDEAKQQQKIPEFFQLRKSTRVCKSDQKKNELARITHAILSKTVHGLEVRNIEGKGRGVFATRPFSKNDFVCEYAGDLIGLEEAKKRDEVYSQDDSVGCYMYYIQHKGKKYCIDATAENDTFGRLLNHSKTDGNCKTTIHAIKGKPHLILIAMRDIETGEELTYDYGDRSKQSLESHPWLKT